jgi:hypothetical protein
LGQRVRDAWEEERRREMEVGGLGGKGKGEEYRGGDLLVVFRRDVKPEYAVGGKGGCMVVRVEGNRRSLDKLFVTTSREGWMKFKVKDRKEVEVGMIKGGNLVTANREFTALASIER